MSYNFLKKAQLQPDLNDFCEYLKKPLSVLEEIQDHYKNLQLTKKVDPSNLETYHKIDVILEKHLPEMVNTYCDFSFDYRNSKSIDINNISITPKELLLKNLAKVIEEIEVIETDFNRNNSFNAVIQNKVLENYGHKPQLCLETGKVVNNNLQLDNKFDYEEFTQNNQFKKPKLIKDDDELEAISKKADDELEAILKKADDDDVAEESSGGGSFGLISVLLVLAMVTMLTLVTMTMYSGTKKAYSEKQFQSKILHIQASVNTLYANRTNFEGLNNKILIDSNIVTKAQLILPWDENKTINITSTSLDKVEDSILIEIPIGTDKNESACKAIFKMGGNFDMIKVGDIVVKANSPSEASNFLIDSFLTTCLSGEHKTISLIDKG